MSLGNLIAGVIALFHAGFSLFALGVPPALLFGVILKRSWADNSALRLIHLLCLGVLLLRVLLLPRCPLSNWEDVFASSSPPSTCFSFLHAVALRDAPNSMFGDGLLLLTLTTLALYAELKLRLQIAALVSVEDSKRTH